MADEEWFQAVGRLVAAGAHLEHEARQTVGALLGTHGQSLVRGEGFGVCKKWVDRLVGPDPDPWTR